MTITQTGGKLACRAPWVVARQSLIFTSRPWTGAVLWKTRDLVVRSVPYKGRERWTAAVCLWNPQGLPGWRIIEKHLLGERCRLPEGGLVRVLNDVNSMWRFSTYGEQQKSKCFSTNCPWLLNLINSKMPSECQVLILKTTILVLASKQVCFSHLFCPWQYIRKLALKILQEWFWSTE